MQNDANNSPPPQARSTLRLLLPLLLLGLALWYFQSRPAADDAQRLSYTQLYALVEQGAVAQVELDGQRITGSLESEQQVDGTQVKEFTSVVPSDTEELLQKLRAQDVEITISDPEQGAGWGVMLALLPWVLIIGVWILIARRARQMGGGMGGGMGGPGGGPFGAMRGHARKIERDTEVKTRFSDVAGMKYAKRDVQEVVEFMRSPDRFRAVGGEVPRGILLAGPPGTGKTLLARAVAGEAGVPFFSINGSEFIELLVGMGAARVRQLFKEAKSAAPAIVFVDELDAVGRSRGTGLGGGNDEREQTLNQLLSEMDGFSSGENVVVMAASNRPDVLDPALLRPGRFDRRVTVERPESQARYEILTVHCKDKPLAEDVSLRAIARQTAGFTGAELKALANEAALDAARHGGEVIKAENMSRALDKVVLGNPREGKLSESEKQRVAVHESGHALVAHVAVHAEPLKRVSILPRGRALGATQQEMAEDKHIQTQGELTDRLRVLMGGYAAEKLVYGDVSSGAESDLKQASEIVFKMVAHFGMSQAIGPLYHQHRQDHPFLGQQAATNGGTSDATVRAIEEECRQLVSEAAEGALSRLEQWREPFDALVQALLERETLEKEELTELLGERGVEPSERTPSAAE